MNDSKAIKIPYLQTGSFSSLVQDYISEHPFLRTFYSVPVNPKGLREAIQNRRGFSTDRHLLVAHLREQYKGLETNPKVIENIEALISTDTFTIITAHQPNILTGYLYLIYKILHTVQLAEEFSQLEPACRFVPVFYIGSEDNDLEELNRINLGGEKYTWNTTQTGAVGRMTVDKSFLQLLDTIEGQLIVLPFGKELMAMLRRAYAYGNTIAQATLILIDSLFSQYGVVVINADSGALKRCMEGVFRDDLKKHQPFMLVEETIPSLALKHKVQVNPREINLFYLKENLRERIVREGAGYKVMNTEITFPEDELDNELKLHPERFSPNVILRGLYQETILPNVAFVGGGSEIAYWLELKRLFDHYAVPFPMLVLRNSFLLVSEMNFLHWQKMGFVETDFFKSEEELMNTLVVAESNQQLRLTEELKEAVAYYNKLAAIAGPVDSTLVPHVEALKAQAMKKLETLEKKILRAEKRKYKDQRGQLQKIRKEITPNNSLQERYENILPYYAAMGSNVIEMIRSHSGSIKQEFSIIVIPD